jgi:ribosomal protein S18 acetylase RimI-like enzyme
VLQIRRLIDLDIRAQVLAQLKEIFFLTSSRTIFSSEKSKEEFFYGWTEYYLKSEPEHVYLAFTDTGSSRLAGYLMGAVNSREGTCEAGVPALALFRDLLNDYPAHLHINAHPSAQGQGVGLQLVAAFLADLTARQAPGVHIVTAPDAHNVAFYDKNGFDFKETRTLGKTPVLFMGRKLNSK